MVGGGWWVVGGGWWVVGGGWWVVGGGWWVVSGRGSLAPRDIGGVVQKGIGQRGVYPQVFGSFGGTERKRPRNAPALASNGLIFNSDALPWRPQLMPSTHTFFLFFSGTVLGLTGSRRRRGQPNPPF